MTLFHSLLSHAFPLSLSHSFFLSFSLSVPLISTICPSLFAMLSHSFPLPLNLLLLLLLHASIIFLDSSVRSPGCLQNSSCDGRLYLENGEIVSSLVKKVGRSIYLSVYSFTFYSHFFAFYFYFYLFIASCNFFSSIAIFFLLSLYLSPFFLQFLQSFFLIFSSSSMIHSSFFFQILLTLWELYVLLFSKE